MIAEILKITDKVKNSPGYKDILGYSVNLPLFSPNLSYAYQKDVSDYVLRLWQINHGTRYPAWIPFINNDDYEKINIYWDGVVNEGLEKFEFLL